MPQVEYIGWPFTDAGPIVTEHEGKKARLRLLCMMSYGENRVRPTMGTPIDDIHFEQGVAAVEQIVSIGVRNSCKEFEPGIVFPQGRAGVAVSEEGDGEFAVGLSFVDTAEPRRRIDSLEVRLRNG